MLKKIILSIVLGIASMSCSLVDSGDLIKKRFNENKGTVLNSENIFREVIVDTTIEITETTNSYSRARTTHSLVINKPVTTSSIYSPEYNSRNLVDDDMSSLWGSAVNNPNYDWLYIELGVNIISAISLFWYDKYYATDFIVYGSNDENLIKWTQLLEKTNNVPDSKGNNSFVFTNDQTYKYIGILFKSRNSVAYGLKEIALYSGPVKFSDSNLENLVREIIKTTEGSILPFELSSITEINAAKKNITDLSGLQYCDELTSLDLNNNSLDGLFCLMHLNQLKFLDISNNNMDLRKSTITGQVNWHVLDLLIETGTAVIWKEGNQID